MQSELLRVVKSAARARAGRRPQGRGGARRPRVRPDRRDDPGHGHDLVRAADRVPPLARRAGEDRLGGAVLEAADRHPGRARRLVRPADPLPMPHRIALLVTGASGMQLPRHLLRTLAARDEVERIHLVVSAGASQVLRHELGADADRRGRPGGGVRSRAGGRRADHRAPRQRARRGDRLGLVPARRHRDPAAELRHPRRAGHRLGAHPGAPRRRRGAQGALAAGPRLPRDAAARSSISRTCAGWPTPAPSSCRRCPPSTSAASRSTAFSTTTPCASSIGWASTRPARAGCVGPSPPARMINPDRGAGCE